MPGILDTARGAMPRCWYAVAKGSVPGVYPSWKGAWRVTKGHSGQRVQGFNSRLHAENWIFKIWKSEALLTLGLNRQDLNPRFGSASKVKKKDQERLEFWGHNIPGKTWTREEIIEGVTKRWEQMKQADEIRLQRFLISEEEQIEKQKLRDELRHKAVPAHVIRHLGQVIHSLKNESKPTSLESAFIRSAMTEAEKERWRSRKRYNIPREPDQELPRWKESVFERASFPERPKINAPKPAQPSPPWVERSKAVEEDGPRRLVIRKYWRKEEIPDEREE
ncbi:hypothetical protein EX30DRAFT_368029 [Ascodesmis nigricans]|uniref:Ribonuclease H1 N-terminal domain-containing protein n=1 Tax=Ascodesmis nigricans TaxID=341454 RepID=A0A4S2N6J6_9PEZI|nr:hypothetical protein EX30DRAFT_368029 [Ascodesmis nigricans]